MQSVYSDFGKRFKELRESCRYTQEQIAEYMGVEARQISRIETGKCFTTLDNLKKIASLYNIEISDLFKFEHLKSKDELISATVQMLRLASEKDCRTIFKIAKDLIY